MFSILKSIWMAALLYVLRRRQHDNARLRRLFRERYNIDVGYYSYGCFDRWRMPGPMTVGRYCSIASTVRVAPRNHPVSALTTHPILYETKFGLVRQDPERSAALVIADDVWIGHNAVILPGCKHIGRGAIIGAGAIVTRDVPAYTIVAGNPASKLYDRFDDETIAAIESSQWWLLDLDDLARIYADTPEVLQAPTAERLKVLLRRIDPCV